MEAKIALMPSLAVAGRVLGTLAYVGDRRHRRIVKRNLQFTHPEWSPDLVRALSLKVFQQMGMTALEICQLACLSREEILRRVRIKGQEHLLSAAEHRRGALLISAHLGNWEMAHIFLACYLRIPIVLVARKLQSRTLDRWVHNVRTRFGNVILDRKGALPKLTRTLRQGGVAGLLIDQGTTRWEGVKVDFFGRAVSATPAPALLARRCGSPVLPVFCVREAGRDLTLRVYPPLALQSTRNLREDLQANTQIMNDAVERAVRAYPEQWFWFHKRWKRHYPELYPEDLAKRQRKREKRRAS